LNSILFAEIRDIRGRNFYTDFTDFHGYIKLQITDCRLMKKGTKAQRHKGAKAEGAKGVEEN